LHQTWLRQDGTRRKKLRLDRVKAAFRAKNAKLVNNSLGSAFIGLGKEPAALRFREALKEAVTQA
jgi:hypothetical protein